MHVKSFMFMEEYIPSVSEVQYLKLFENGQWTGATTLGQESTFPAQQWPNVKLQKFHNCGKPGCGVDICPTPKYDSRIKVNRKQFLDTKKKGENGGGGGGERPGTEDRFRKPDDGDSYNQRTIDGKLMYYHFRDGRLKPVDNTPAQISSAEKSAANVAKLAAAAAAAGILATAPASTGVPDTNKLRATNFAKIVFEQLNIAMKAELDEP
jgi:hypothetical protein